MNAPRSASRLAVVLIFALSVGGCAGIGQSLRVESTVLVKVPIEDPIKAGASADGWEFRHVLQAPTDEERRGQWYVAWNNQKPLRFGGIFPSWGRLFARTPEIARATHAAFGSYPVLIEPNRTFVRIASKAPEEPNPGEPPPPDDGAGVRLDIHAEPMKVWSDNRVPDPEHPGQFVIDPMWHLDEKHSQLAAARARVSNPGNGIVIGHIDNGLDGRHPAAPKHLVRGNWRANAVGLLEYARGERPTPPLAPEQTGAIHGLGTAGILAGNKVSIAEMSVKGGRIKSYEGWLGGAPFAKIVPVRAAPWVFSIGTAELAYAIDHASRVQRADIITMSHGGSPTQAWVDAINAAYERGTAMFAAESDFFSLMPDPFPPNGIFIPASPVYPAAFRRVVGVAGATADYRSYGRNTLSRLLRSPTSLLKWMARGSYGADGTSTVLYRPSRKPDRSQTWRQGQLRPHPISAYSPNIPWLSATRDKNGRIKYGIDLDGAGTSASTPQVAAAAALWLQKHRHEFSAQEWRQWKKAEAVYYALLKSADRQGKRGPDRYLGAGLLRANDALAISYSEMKRARRPPGRVEAEHVPEGSLWFERAGRDYFDGARSALSVLGLHTLRQVPTEERAGLKQKPETETTEMQRLYFNMMLLREWHGGDIPQKKHVQMYLRRAQRKAEKVAAVK